MGHYFAPATSTVPTEAAQPPESSQTTKRRRQPPPLPLWTRIVLYAAGAALVLIGIAGLALPGIQGILTIGIGIAVLTTASDTVHRLVRRALSRWPQVHDRLDRWRHRLHERLGHRQDDSEDG